MTIFDFIEYILLCSIRKRLQMFIRLINILCLSQYYLRPKKKIRRSDVYAIFSNKKIDCIFDKLAPIPFYSTIHSLSSISSSLYYLIVCSMRFARAIVSQFFHLSFCEKKAKKNNKLNFGE